MIYNQFLLADIVKGTQGEVVHLSASDFDGISTDTRADNTKKLFIALKGESYDAHDFLDKAIASGAAGILLHKNEKILSTAAITEAITVIKVNDTLEALQALAKYWRHKQKAQVLALTGTNGKTTTKEFLYKVLSYKFNVCASQGSLNNHWGVPLSLLRLNPSHQFMISEMGMNHPGEISTLCKVAEPDFTLVTNVGRGHLEGMGSIEDVAKEKQEIYIHAPDSKKIFNVDNPYTKSMWEALKTKEDNDFTFSLQDVTADVHFSSVQIESDFLKLEGTIAGLKGAAQVKVFGVHNAYNLAATAAGALACGMQPVDIWAALPFCETIWGRNQWVTLKSGARALFDAYNANPESMHVFLQNTAAMTVKGKKIYILGDMRELGKDREKEHANLALALNSIDFDQAYFIGENGHYVKTLMSGKNIIISDVYKENLALELKSMLQPQDTIFLKASRGVQLEKFLLDLDPLDFSPKK